MGKITAKFQVTLPRHVADRLGVAPGDEIHWDAHGPVVRVSAVPKRPRLSVDERLRLFDESTDGQNRRQRRLRRVTKPTDRGWTREDAYLMEDGLPRGVPRRH